ncbi:probable 3',5'-cyclic phosphodiesterase pde-5 isoform X2 [Wyeomyia smithii]|uniref:probable 3',5'-cyclic phosphodiesterase pde-5 isoform X2 n=1 Tax=Wyeomyia smithii TaxID=174621 RepID=UPI002467E6EA|nr:probable 3',5'-cyclic phosphodiesterase pde-5 isoform X2 [Wyeomyia smithii]XP_055540308.1 probable 3',5'-cyclic phosphodiesterase pde-5 isoform X2 [Wyeomyia smithii]XP_055540309.1 probable 3',5'-cyclic phosphodiesterase pde-5 isoform X2 [Wyeomyia smithii]XP_055540310.1 probable 3',5'-cyclic phosphodiesterase pde-5 isoform X2 [Wyeomyia smithii]XP_055540311.1 probable 3',5'-cyclic phosphodiesterase pde-5 isoform X2 [Wyeomyia smithii]XP_055540312.1 probable 3',5'-cyclic phosphodiesterase pde-5
MEIVTRIASSFAGLWRNRRRTQHETENLHNRNNSNNEKLTDIQITRYLQQNPEFLDTFIMDEIQLEQVERWMIRKTQRIRKIPQQTGKNGRKTSLSRWKFCVHADKRQMLQDLINSLQLRPTKMHVLWELASCICSAVNADGFRLYLTDAEAESLHLCLSNNFIDENGEPKPLRIKSDAAIPNFVAKSREPIRFSRGDCDHRFEPTILDKSEMAHVMCQPIVYPDGSLVAVLELWRRDCGSPFYEEDEEIGCSYLVWGGIAIHYAHLNLVGLKHRKLNDFLLAVVKSIFQDMVSMDMLVSKIMNFAQRLVDADRASLFLVDSKNKELYATIFDIGCEDKISSGENGNENNTVPKEIRFPIGTGIAGQVAMTGEILNIIDAYADTRFNRSIDQLTGYKTETILCMPIFIRGSVIGVVQMINKRTGYFTKEDEEAFEMFAVYCGLALHHAKLFDKIRRSEQKYRVALEVLSYHNTCSEQEVDKCLTVGIPKKIPGIDSYDFSPFEINDFQKALYSVYMFKDLFGLGRFDKTNLIRFTLTVKKNYRRVPYHNWTHGFSVANTMYSIIKNCSSIFRPNECLALFIGSLCHDLDHRGKNNKFMLDTESPLAAIYSTSTMEHHHFNQTVTILQQEGHNIFSKLSSTEYKQVLSLIKHCILATDLALFFPNKEKLNALVDNETFSWTISEHRMLIQAIAMTGADLSASAKPWEVQTETVKVIFAEFYDQGDEEKRAGRKPIPMMDRDKPGEQAASQLGFLTGICIPCYTLLHRLIPETKPMLNMCNENLSKWQDIAKGIRKFDQ